MALGEIEMREQKDIWDKLVGLTPLIATTIVGLLGLYFTNSYENANAKLRELEAVQKLLPHLSGADAGREEQKLALVALRELGSPQIATQFAEILGTEGAIDALRFTASTSTSEEERESVNQALGRLLTSAKTEAGITDDEGSGRYFALSGMIVGHGDLIHSVTPVFSQYLLDGSIGDSEDGERYGGEGPYSDFLKPGHLVTEVRVTRGDYFGARHVIHIQVVWQKLTPDGLDSNKITSERLGTGAYASDLVEVAYTAPTNHYISDLFVPPSEVPHTSGEIYLTDLEANFKQLPFARR
jgi:hypothetical protein